ncbi:MAG: DUF6259 domain-containing protein [Verrucomicrobia bacterium]|nr:DUF6259 domain-containing protein [Verrucomicrobiota bacterium]
MKTATIVFWLLTAALAAAAEPVIDATSAERWTACVNWVQKRPARFEVSGGKEGLVFTAEGAGTEMPWLLDLRNAGLSGDERYLLVRYKATGIATTRGGYFLHGEEGTVGGRTYAVAEQAKPDGKWHTLAVDLVALDPLQTTHSLVIKVSVDNSGSARLTIGLIWFADALPPDAQVAESPQRVKDKTVVLNWQTAGAMASQASWTRTPAANFEAKPDGSAMTFAVRDGGKGMRWLLNLSQPVDLKATPYLSVRYKASGALAGATYALWFGNNQSSTNRQATVPIFAKDIQTDGAWHNVSLKLSDSFAATQLAVGLDCLSGEAALTLDTIRFSSRSPRWKVAEAMAVERRGAPWPAGKDGFAAEPIRVAGGKLSAFFLQRMELADWFDSSHVTVAGVPFEMPTEAAQIPQTGTENFGALSLALPPGVREVYLLTANSAPATEPWGVDWKRPRSQETLDVPEKVFYEIRYESGRPDRVLPLDVATGRWGMKRGLSVNVVHPDPVRRATELVLHDRMQTASFAIVAATVRRDAPCVAEPNWDRLPVPPAPARTLASARPRPADASEPVVNAGALQARFDMSAGLEWSQLSVADSQEPFDCAQCPVFEVELAGRLLNARDWALEKMKADGAARCFWLRNAKAQLAARVECAPGRGNELRMRMTLTNTSDAPVTATLHFPVLRDVRIGCAPDTCYLFGRRGGIIHSANVRFREPLGERHPMQVDGFFCPWAGIALACLTHDTVAQHHFINLAKTDGGGEWHPEYVERDLAPGGSFTATEAALVLCEGDWRAIFAAYTGWLKTWFKPVAPRKPWFERAFALASGSAHYDGHSSPQERGAVWPAVDLMLKHIGLCDYTHLFGWSASKQYGDWGDYDHYDETVGGLESFRENIRRVQDGGIAVSLYLDGYLSSGKGQFAGSHAKEWAMKRPDGSPQHVPAYDAFNECPYQKGWQDYLSAAYRRVQGELRPKVMYVDEFGATDGRWICYAKDHGHNSYEIPYAGEVAMLRRIREAVSPDVALYTEYPPAEVSRQILDGSITYQALWSADEEALAPHFIDLPRFAFPDFKQLHIIHYVVPRAGNWWLFKFPFFNGEVYRVGVPGLPYMDAPSLAFLKRAIEVQCAHRAAFASHDVVPLVPTEVSGVFANLFRAPKENVWTLYNANGRSVGKPVLRVKHVRGATYEDAWSGKPLTPAIRDGFASLALELEPKGIGCVAQRLP